MIVPRGKDGSVPTYGDAKSDKEGNAGSKRHCGEMQCKQGYPKSREAENGVCQQCCCGGTADDAM